ncbi:MAG TPA: Hsp33 family molecular chaperone HslO [Chloroflexota bacterium]|nr:Hsp33 family molecular chaperone HslO [Chloroflexota bacterium]
MAQEDYLVRTMAADGQIRAFCCRTTNLSEEAHLRHGTLPTATAALGRVLTGAAMLGALLKREERVTLQLIGDGPLGSLVGEADAHGHVRGYVQNPEVHLPSTPAGKLDVAGAVGHNGNLYVLRDLGLKEPYRGSVSLVSGEIAEDLTYYFVRSEQTPSAVALGVLVETTNSVRAAGGYLLQLMPGADPHLGRELEEIVRRTAPASTLIDQGQTPEAILSDLLGSLGVGEMTHQPLVYQCRCSRERLSRALVTLGPTELSELAGEPAGAELICRFCGAKYQFSPDDLRALAEATAQESGTELGTH